MGSRTYPEAAPDISQTATAFADPSRAAMCAALMDGRAWTVGELAKYCGLARSTATEHVDTLVQRGVVVDVRQGRHRYVQLAGEEIARIIESLGLVAQSRFRSPGSLRASSLAQKTRAGRTCYKHLAGNLGIAIADQFKRCGYLTDAWNPTPTGRDLFDSWGIAGARTVTAIPCMDSSERRFHLSGPLGRALCDTFFDLAWIERIGETRAVKLTPLGTSALSASGIWLAPTG